MLRSRGITHRSARRGIESSTSLGRHRCVVERSLPGSPTAADSTAQRRAPSWFRRWRPCRVGVGEDILAQAGHWRPPPIITTTSTAQKRAPSACAVRACPADRILPDRPRVGRTQRFGDQSRRPHRYPRRTADRDLANIGTGAHRPRCARCGGGPYGDCQAGRSVRPEPPTSRRRTTGSGSTSATGPGSLSCSRFRGSGRTERTFIRSRTVSSAFARRRSDAHVWQRRRTIGRQVGTNAQFLDTELHRFQ